MRDKAACINADASCWCGAVDWDDDDKPSLYAVSRRHPADRSRMVKVATGASHAAAWKNARDVLCPAPTAEEGERDG